MQFQQSENLPLESYNVCILKNTERPFTGKYLDSKEKGIYQCIVCHNSLFSSDAKFDSGSGWPSFFDALKYEESVKEPNEPKSTNIPTYAVNRQSDDQFGMHRTEITCAKCNAHLGHLFDDGPPPTGIRFCINSCSLDFKRS